MKYRQTKVQGMKLQDMELADHITGHNKKA